MRERAARLGSVDARVANGGVAQAGEIAMRLQARDARLRVIRFRRNFGQTAAFAAGFAHARGGNERARALVLLRMKDRRIFASSSSTATRSRSR